jgi:hypothetical protein
VHAPPLHLKRRADHALDLAAHSRTLEVLARLGYGSRGIIHLVIGAWAARAAMGRLGGASPGSVEAVSFLGHVGRLPIIVVAIGLLGFGIWRFIQAFADTERKGRSIIGLLTRFGFLVTGAFHLTLVPLAVKLAVGAKVDTRDPTKATAAYLMAKPAGRWIVGILGALLLYSALAQLVESVRAKYAEDFRGCELRKGAVVFAVLIGRIGIAARAIVFGAMALWIMRAALAANPWLAKGLGESMASLRDREYGSELFSFVAFGTLAYALFSFMYAQFRRIAPEQPTALE